MQSHICTYNRNHHARYLLVYRVIDHVDYIYIYIYTVKPVYKVYQRDWPQSGLYRQVDFISRVIFVEE